MNAKLFGSNRYYNVDPVRTKWYVYLTDEGHSTP